MTQAGFNAKIKPYATVWNEGKKVRTEGSFKSLQKQKSDWLKAAFAVLAQQGIEAVRVEVLAREMGVTKGSFYWHFQNRAELLTELLRQWATETEKLIEFASKAATPLERLQDLFGAISTIAVAGGLPDSAIFLWSRQDGQVAEQVQQVEQKRLNFLLQTLVAYGLQPDEAAWRAELAYLAFLGFQERAGREVTLLERFPEFSQRLVQQLLDLPNWVNQNKPEE